MDKEEFNKKAKDEMKKFAEASKSAFEKAGDKVQKFTDKSVLKIERKQLESKRSGKYEELGMKISALLLQGAEIKFENQEELDAINAIQNEINDLSEQIQNKDDLIK